MCQTEVQESFQRQSQIQLSMVRIVLFTLCLMTLASYTTSVTQQQHQKQASLLNHALQQLASEHEAHVEDLREFVRFPSVSALPQHGDDLRKTAHWVAARLTKAGMQVGALIHAQHAACS